MISYIHFYDLQIGPFPIHPFGLLVALGVAIVLLARIMRRPALAR
jgi:hypothetical protein